MRVPLSLILLIVLGCATHGKTGDVRALAVRLHPGDDLRAKLEELVSRRGLHGAYVATCVGSLRVAAIRFADRKETTTLDGPFEIVSLTGTLSPDGPHLHIASPTPPATPSAATSPPARSSTPPPRWSSAKLPAPGSGAKSMWGRRSRSWSSSEELRRRIDQADVPRQQNARGSAGGVGPSHLRVSGWGQTFAFR